MRKVKWVMGCCGSSPVPAEKGDRDLFRHFRDIEIEEEAEEGEEETGREEMREREEGGNAAAIVLAAFLSAITASMYVLSF